MQQEAAHLGRMFPSEDEHRSAHRRREQHTPPTHDRVVIGASAGGIEALLMLLTHLPAGLAASLFIVQHLSPSKPSQLATILRRAARLPVQWAAENRAITPSTIYVAPPDHHLLLLEDGRLHLGTGPKEQRFRPSINVLFRSAAHSYGPRVIGVLLSGMNADGTEGLQAIQQQGGVAIIQDPRDAAFARMPQSAVAHVKSDYIMPVSGMAPVLLRLVTSSAAGDRW
jgi:two-component system chemotaxis response regulator CheB